MNSIEEITNLLIGTLIKKGYISSKILQDKHYRVSELFHQSAILFNILCQTYLDLAWKSKMHSDGTMFPGDFIVGIETPLGNMSNHYKMDYYDAFDIRELDKAPVYDRYEEDVAIRRLNSLPLIDSSYVQTEKTISLIPELTKELTPVENIINQLTYALWKLNEFKFSKMNTGYHDIKDLYRRRRREYFKLICHNYKDLSWKSELDIAGQRAPEGTFLVGLHTDYGHVSFILNKEYYDEFNVPVLLKSPLLLDEVKIAVPQKLTGIKIRQMKV